MPKIHMKSAINRDTKQGLIKTLCGIYVNDTVEIANNPSDINDVTCANCLKIYQTWKEEHGDE